MTANHETYLLMAGTQNDMEDWVKSIRRVIWAPFGGGESAREHARLQAAQRHRGDFVVSRCQPEFEEEETRTVKIFPKSGTGPLFSLAAQASGVFLHKALN